MQRNSLIINADTQVVSIADTYDDSPSTNTQYLHTKYVDKFNIMGKYC